MNFEYQILLALFIDFLLGDPRWFPHPVKLIGLLAEKMETICREIIQNERVAGFFTVLIVLVVTGFSGWGMIQVAGILHPLIGDMVSILILYSCFAARDLINHSNNVYEAFKKEDLAETRQRVGMIVGRDTTELDEVGIVRATVESVAENTVDGVTAPLFWAVIGGPLGALLYKAVNTMDSIFGYKNDRYLHFGWLAARLDDLVNFLPARVTGLLMVVSAFLLGLEGRQAWRIFCRDRLQHASPNSGHPEAAVAGALGIQLGGESVYFGRAVVKPMIGDAENIPASFHITQVNHLLVVTTILSTVLFCIGRFLFVT